jgi:hypothetical protein
MLDGPSCPQWSPVRFLPAGGTDLVRCHTCSGLVALVDAAAHVDWHRSTSERVNQIADRVDDVLATLCAQGEPRPTSGRPAGRQISAVYCSMSIVRDALVDVRDSLRTG